MNLSVRQSIIVDLLAAQGAVSVDGLAAYFGVTPQTIRRDLNHLYEADLVRRRHGGAELNVVERNAPFQTRRITHLQAKARIGRAVAKLIPAGASLLLGFGTTPEQVALALADHRDLTVVTNNISAALALSHNMSHRVVLTGGELRQPNPEILGPGAERLFNSFKADFGVSGVGGFDSDGALLDFDMAESDCHKALRGNCRVRILVLDHTKFGRRAPVRSGSLDDVDILVSDQPIPEPYRDQIPARVQLVIADEVQV
ncbi:DeoR/GlpR family DNA-binding transcription regulator [Alcaligenes ammonioxydans]|uniref:DeoR/GlpR transcriptional regulator n=1 Tax=Alcaligenes ammonioxydans TaxID=2582914 RepID=A0ABX8SSY8_9BURK|nr:DeoR/GlpR family DNA-binding transcription regulator [Alcaligenes ammonioxydans]QBH19930.1 DeoR/GlpR transcriptional regulator [Alcaligenes faecalis]QXX77948.1 DeoR/GlpR transcriptional regulator [Alcaligenes ammonioxydans]